MIKKMETGVAMDRRWIEADGIRKKDEQTEMEKQGAKVQKKETDGRNGEEGQWDAKL